MVSPWVRQAGSSAITIHSAMTQERSSCLPGCFGPSEGMTGLKIRCCDIWNRELRA